MRLDVILLDIIEQEWKQKALEAVEAQERSDRQIDSEVRRAQTTRQRQAHELRISRAKAAKLDKHIRRFIQ